VNFLSNRLPNGDMNILKLVAPSPVAQETGSKEQPPADKASLLKNHGWYHSEACLLTIMRSESKTKPIPSPSPSL